MLFHGVVHVALLAGAYAALLGLNFVEVLMTHSFWDIFATFGARFDADNTLEGWKPR